MFPKFQLILGAFAATIITVMLLWEPWESVDLFFWPASAQGRIHEMASVLRKIEGPARWCYPSRNALNLADNSKQTRAAFSICVAQIEPVTDFKEIPKDYMQRFYRAKHGSFICEVNLSTTWNDDRIVGSDCYYGLFREQDDTGVGMTDDKPS